MSNTPRLSICIPTFNRRQYLEELINSLLPQARLGCIELCISDNHSTDGTTDYLKELANRKDANLKIRSQAYNVGIDENMISAIGMASGDYIYPLGDDDFLPFGSVEKILKVIESGADLIILNGWHTDPSLSPLRIHLNDSYLGYATHKPEIAFMMFWDKMPFGSFLATRRCFSKNHFHRYVGTSHAYTGAVWDALSEITETKGVCKVISMEIPTVLLRGAKKTWHRDAARIMVIEIPYWFSLVSENNIYKKVVEEVRQDYMNNIMSHTSLLNFRMSGQLGIEDVSSLSVACNRQQYFKIALYAMLPISTIQQMKKLKANIKAFCHRFK